MFLFFLFLFCKQFAVYRGHGGFYTGANIRRVCADENVYVKFMRVPVAAPKATRYGRNGVPWYTCYVILEKVEAEHGPTNGHLGCYQHRRRNAKNEMRSKMDHESIT